MTSYQLGIMFSIGTYNADKDYFVFRHQDKYFPAQLQPLLNTTIYQQFYKDKPQYVIKSRRHSALHESLLSYNWIYRNAEARYFPTLPPSDYPNFLRAYIEIHSGLSINSGHPRLRIYGNQILISAVNEILAGQANVAAKTPQAAHNNKTAILYYQSRREIAAIYKYIDGSPKHEAYWDNVATLI